MVDLTTKKEFQIHAIDDEIHTTSVFKRFCYNYPEWYFDETGESLLGSSQDIVQWQWMVGVGLNPYGKSSGGDHGTFGGIRAKLDNFVKHGSFTNEGLKEVRTITMWPETASTSGWLPRGNQVYLNLVKIKKYAPRPKLADGSEQEESDGFRRDGAVGEGIIMEVVAENHLMNPLPERFSDIPKEVLTEAELANVEWLACSKNAFDTEANLNKYITWDFGAKIDLSEVERLVMCFSIEPVVNEADFKRKFRQKGKASLTNSGSGGWAGDEESRRGILGFEIFFASFTDSDGSMFEEGGEITEHDILKEGKEPLFVNAGSQRAVAVRLRTNHYNAIEGENLATGWALNTSPHRWRVDAVYKTTSKKNAYYCPLFIFNYDPPMKNRYLAREDIGEIATTEKDPLFDETAYTPRLTGDEIVIIKQKINWELPTIVNLDATDLIPTQRYLLRLTAE